MHKEGGTPAAWSSGPGKRALLGSCLRTALPRALHSTPRTRPKLAGPLQGRSRGEVLRKSSDSTSQKPACAQGLKQRKAPVASLSRRASSCLRACASLGFLRRHLRARGCLDAGEEQVAEACSALVKVGALRLSTAFHDSAGLGLSRTH